MVSLGGDDDAGSKTVGNNDDDGDYITVEETPIGGDDDGTGDADGETSINETSDGPTPAPTEEDDGDTGGEAATNDTPMPVKSAGTEASADIITSELIEKYGIMPTTIDDCVNTEDETFTYTDENDNHAVTINCTALADMETWYLLPCDDNCHIDLEKIVSGIVEEALRETRGRTNDGEVVDALEEAARNAADAERFMENDVFEVKPKQTVEEAQKQLDQMREISDKGEEELRALDEDLQIMLDNIPDGPPEAVEAYQKGLGSIDLLKKLITEHMTMVAKDLLKAERALKRANGELKVTFPENSVEGE